jgi:hypothetical protein
MIVQLTQQKEIEKSKPQYPLGAGQIKQLRTR